MIEACRGRAYNDVRDILHPTTQTHESVNCPIAFSALQVLDCGAAFVHYKCPPMACQTIACASSLVQYVGFQEDPGFEDGRRAFVSLKTLACNIETEEAWQGSGDVLL